MLIHTLGIGPQLPGFRSAAGRPLLLEDVLVRHPDLRVFVENTGYPYLDEMTAMMYQFCTTTQPGFSGSAMLVRAARTSVDRGGEATKRPPPGAGLRPLRRGWSGAGRGIVVTERHRGAVPWCFPGRLTGRLRVVLACPAGISDYSRWALKGSFRFGR